MFQPLRARVARHLLDLSVRESRGLVVHVTQDDLAHSVGSVREVIARALKSLDDDGLIERAPRTIRLLDPCGAPSSRLRGDRRRPRYASIRQSQTDSHLNECDLDHGLAGTAALDCTLYINLLCPRNVGASKLTSAACSSSPTG